MNWLISIHKIQDKKTSIKGEGEFGFSEPLAISFSVFNLNFVIKKV